MPVYDGHYRRPTAEELADARDDLDPRYCDSCGGPCGNLREHYPWIRRP